MTCQCYGCPMNCKNMHVALPLALTDFVGMHIHRSIYWKMDRYYQEKNKDNYLPSKVKD